MNQAWAEKSMVSPTDISVTKHEDGYHGICLQGVRWLSSATAYFCKATRILDRSCDLNRQAAPNRISQSLEEVMNTWPLTRQRRMVSSHMIENHREFLLSRRSTSETGDLR